MLNKIVRKIELSGAREDILVIIIAIIIALIIAIGIIGYFSNEIKESKDKRNDK